MVLRIVGTYGFSHVHPSDSNANNEIFGKWPTLRTLIFARHSFSRVHIFAAYIFAPGALEINIRYVSIFAWWLFSFFPPENPLEVIFAPVHMTIYIVRNLTC